LIPRKKHNNGHWTVWILDSVGDITTSMEYLDLSKGNN
jgi:hypothetical protein